MLNRSLCLDERKKVKGGHPSIVTRSMKGKEISLNWIQLLDTHNDKGSTGSWKKSVNRNESGTSIG